MSEQERSEAAEIHRCRKCGTLWRRWPDGNYSLIENKAAGSCCDNAPMGAQIEQLWPPTVNLRIAYLEGTVIPHARKQEHANGFQAGWHAAIDRVQSGDKPDELKDLIPDSRAEQQPIGREKEPHCDDCDNPAALCICAFQRMSEEAARINTQTSASEPQDDAPNFTQAGPDADWVCEHGTAADVHCCECRRSGFFPPEDCDCYEAVGDVDGECDFADGGHTKW